MKRHSQQTDQREQQWQPAVEELEQRIVPGTLTISPKAVDTGPFVTSLPFAPNKGLTMAQESTGGVVTWTPGT